jgi:hypothetical protein
MRIDGDGRGTRTDAASATTGRSTGAGGRIGGDACGTAIASHAGIGDADLIGRWCSAAGAGAGTGAGTGAGGRG